MDYLILILPLSLLPVFYYRDLYKKEKNQRLNIAKDLDILSKQQIFFIKKMIHEMKTPLSAIELHLSIMAKEHCCTKSVAMIKSSTRTLATIYDDIAFHAGKEKICYPAEWIELEEFVADRVLYFDAMATIKNIFLDFHVESDFYICMSRVELQRLIDNTLSNAIKYSKKSSEIVEIIITNDNEELNLIFRDKGIGMSEAEVQNLFKEYYRVSNNIQGLGLGMSIIKEICDDYGISIKIQSIKKEGTTFIYKIPKEIVKREVKNRGVV
ncbi:MAG: HAMP domain-containing sensor histidine kinase [Sulfurimonas sp.]|uniref:sensor histidine kinase n=1 Tax=Sulfurimonas sp. TaxID=2022749 RepID=UPI002613B010|nr:HAMP domain-containing sensor histidine kinase [Sulfurimonas sp.]MDD5400002.1 HAMP domain-containing sensor histidine kinase [Sulfurimonas sp.]